MRVEMRMALLLGVALGFMVALTPACTKPCSETCKTGCCDAAGKCQAGDVATACGTGGLTCGACPEGQTCTDQVCVTPPMMMVDAGPGPCMNDSDCRTDARGPICESGACIAKCKNDIDCAKKMNGSICDLMGGKCAPALIGTRLGQSCNQNNECQEGLDSDDPCFSGGTGCICHQGDKPANTSGSGTCRRRLSPCEECTTDEQCGNDGAIFGPPGGIGVGKCAAFMGDVSGKKYCRYQRVGQCPCGTIDDGAGYCAPQSNSCSQVGCNVDMNCPGGSVCSVNQPDAGASSCGGICVPRCRWDFIEKTNVNPGCRSGEVCWVDSKNLDPSSIFYGSGRCKPPCNDDNDCRGSSNAFGGPNLTCRGEKDSSGGDTAKRCRANGACMDNAECPEKSNVDDPYLGYCDRATFACEDNTCRTGDDPVTGLAYRDCRSPHACTLDGTGARICKKQTCVEQGGAGNACSTGEYCCGEDKNDDGRPDPCPPAAELNDVGCYRAPEPPFCATCMSDQECNNKPLPGYLTGANACPNGSLSPSCSPLPMKCVVGLQTMNGQLTVCAPATLNDRSPVSAGVSRTKADRGCPVNYDETPIRIDRSSSDGPDTCAVDSDCQVGAPMGRCAADPQRRLPDGGPILSCLCPAGSGKAQCPNDADAGIASECLSGVPGTPSFCIESYVCVFPGARYVQPRDGGFGCGLTAP